MDKEEMFETITLIDKAPTKQLEFLIKRIEQNIELDQMVEDYYKN